MLWWTHALWEKPACERVCVHYRENNNLGLSSTSKTRRILRSFRNPAFLNMKMRLPELQLQCAVVAAVIPGLVQSRTEETTLWGNQMCLTEMYIAQVSDLCTAAVSSQQGHGREWVGPQLKLCSGGLAPHPKLSLHPAAEWQGRLPLPVNDNDSLCSSRWKDLADVHRATFPCVSNGSRRESQAKWHAARFKGAAAVLRSGGAIGRSDCCRFKVRCVWIFQRLDKGVPQLYSLLWA